MLKTHDFGKVHILDEAEVYNINDLREKYRGSVFIVDNDMKLTEDFIMKIYAYSDYFGLGELRAYLNSFDNPDDYGLYFIDGGGSVI
jgi:hypothetical protein